jgi:hypothetical protein
MLVDQPVTPCLPGTPHGCRPRSSPRQGQPRRRLGEEDTHAQGMLVKFGDVLDVFAFTCLAVLKLLHRVGMRALSSVRESRLSSRHAQGTVQRRQSTSATLPVWPWISPSPLRAPPVRPRRPRSSPQLLVFVHRRSSVRHRPSWALPRRRARGFSTSPCSDQFRTSPSMEPIVTSSRAQLDVFPLPPALRH